MGRLTGFADPTGDVRIALRRLRSALDDGRADPVVRHHGIDLIVLFGSALTDVDHAHDLDIAIGHNGSLDMLEFMTDLYRLTGSEAIDVIDLNGASEVTKGEVFGTGRPLLQIPRGIFAERAADALTRLWDSKWLRRLQLESLADYRPS